MKAIMVLFDSLNRHMLPPYGGDAVYAPNFQRLAERSVTFDNNWVGSMPCMPARRDLHTGRLGFLHRSWGPLEPFDDSMPRILKENGVHTHLTSDHYHYWETGGATYHTQYSTWGFSRGQEGDQWKGQLADPEIPFGGDYPGKQGPSFRQDWINRSYIPREEQFPQAKTFAEGLAFLQQNHDADRWFLQIETFDPHEPFFSPEAYQKRYPHDRAALHFDWPDYKQVDESPDKVAHCRYEYASLVSMCDAYLGKVLDEMDRLDMWEDTMLIVSTDHGFLLGEHEWWGKNVMPLYTEIARTPMFIWDPRSGRSEERFGGLTQWIDLAPTLLDFFGVDIPDRMLGKSLTKALADGSSREAVLFGYHGAHVNCTDGRYVYMRAPVNPDNTPLYEYTLMPCRRKEMFQPDELQQLELAEPFRFTQGIQLLRIPSRSYIKAHAFGSLLYDLNTDPEQRQPLQDATIEKRLWKLMVDLMDRQEAPQEQYERLGL